MVWLNSITPIFEIKPQRLGSDRNSEFIHEIQYTFEDFLHCSFEGDVAGHAVHRTHAALHLRVAFDVFLLLSAGLPGSCSAKPG
jgi:hypothetical protein